MKRLRNILPVALLCILALSCRNTASDTDRRIERLLDGMTLQEKVGQMAQLTIEPFVIADGAGGFTLDTALLREAVVEYGVGSLLNVPLSESQPAEVWGPFIGELQRIATDETRLGIPLIYGVDQVHGGTYSLGSTLFPQQIALAATWNPAHARRMGEITAYEMRACNIPWNFAPILDLGADPRFPRQYEGFGEDPYLGSVLGRELVKGQEGDDNDVDHPEHVATCLKHFLGYSVPASGKDRTPANIPWNALMEYHLPAFREALDAGAHSVMVNSGIIDNEPVHASRRILTGLLRDELGFDGVVVTDYEDLEKLHARDHLAATSKEAVRIGINAGIDMAMIPIDYRGFCRDLCSLAEEGTVPMERIDEAVRRILKLKFELGLFERPNTLPADYPRYGCEEHRQASYAAAAEAITLLKNDGGLLPLDPAAERRILVCGPNAQSRRALCGGWTVTWQGHGIEHHPELCKTLAEAIGERFGHRNVEVIPGVSYDAHESRYDTERRDRFDEAAEAARRADVVVLCLGENSYCEKPGDLNDLALDPLQTELAERIAATGKPVVLVLSEGRPRLISKFSARIPAIVQSYLPGPQSADAVADVLTGKVNPSGKLPYTYPAFPNSLAVYYHKYADEQRNTDATYKYEGDYNPEFVFGHGLSYTAFAYSGAKLTHEGDEIVITADVTNTGLRDGQEVVQLYSRDLYASLIPDVKRLRRFEKIALKPGQTRTVEFRITTDDLAFHNLENERIAEPGEFLFEIGASSADIRATLPFKL